MTITTGIQDATGVQICIYTLVMSLTGRAQTTKQMLHFSKSSRRLGAAETASERKMDCREDNKKQESRERERKETERRGGMEKWGGGTVLTPACLFYLWAQHGYRCFAAPSHRDMTASLCSHTVPHTVTRALSLLPRPATPHPPRASLTSA